MQALYLMTEHEHKKETPFETTIAVTAFAGSLNMDDVSLHSKMLLDHSCSIASQNKNKQGACQAKRKPRASNGPSLVRKKAWLYCHADVFQEAQLTC